MAFAWCTQCDHKTYAGSFADLHGDNSIAPALDHTRTCFELKGRRTIAARVKLRAIQKPTDVVTLHTGSKDWFVGSCIARLYDLFEDGAVTTDVLPITTTLELGLCQCILWLRTGLSGCWRYS